jgi:hypothetical protein
MVPKQSWQEQGHASKAAMAGAGPWFPGLCGVALELPVSPEDSQTISDASSLMRFRQVIRSQDKVSCQA